MLGELLRCLSPIWPSGSKVQGLPAGDVWPHRWAGGAVGETAAQVDRTTEGWVPFHKLSQWMSYSLLEPLQWAGVTVTGLEALTGLPEYRNGGLLPVSYTHLDVYKRQPASLLPGSARGC